MASAVTLASTTLENQLLECVELIAAKQIEADKNPNGINVVTTYSRNMASGAITVALTIPTEDSLVGGKIQVGAASIYLD